MAKKTFNVDNFRHTINLFLCQSTCSEDIRRGQINALEHVLRESGNYRGYAYLEADKVPAGHPPGVFVIAPDTFGYVRHSFAGTDDTRRHY